METLLYVHLHQKRFSIINYNGRAEILIFLYAYNIRLNAKLSQDLRSFPVLMYTTYLETRILF